MEELQLKVVVGSLEDEPSVFFGRHDHEVGEPGYTSILKFYEELIKGKPYPLTFQTPGIQGVDTMVAIALFLHRDLALRSAMLTLAVSADLVERLGPAGMAHIDRDLARFFQLIRVFLPESGLNKREEGERLQTVVSWIREYVLEDRLPNLPPSTASPTVLDTGTDGFVVAETKGDLYEGWVELYREGYLRGLLLGSEREGRRGALIARKSLELKLDLDQAATILNEAERAMGEFEWQRRGVLWLEGPVEGTRLPREAIQDVLVRV